MKDSKAAYSILLIAVVMLAILPSFASALGVTPARNTLSFSAGQTQEGSFTIVNSEYKDMNLVIYATGELNQSVTVSEREMFMPKTMESKEITYTLTIPSTLSPGPHMVDIVVLEKPAGAAPSEAFVGATVAVSHQIVVTVPYPGKYAIADINIVNAEQNAEATFVIPVVSLGAEDIEQAHAIISIYDINGTKIEQFQTESVSIPSGQRKEIVGKWIAAVPLGRYIAKAHIVYSGGEIDLEKEFAVGSETLELQQVTVPRFTLGGIAKFEMLIENKWSEPITAAYAQTEVYDKNGDVIADFKSPTYDIPPLTKSTFVSYWDTVGVEEGTYDTKVYMRYGSKYSLQSIQLKVSQNEIIALGLGYVISEKAAGGNLTTILIVAIVILVLLNIAWFFVFRRKMH